VTRLPRFATASLACIVLVPALGACRTNRSDRDAVRAVIAQTTKQARAIAYEEKTVARTVRVEAVVEDDLRYRARLAADGRPVYEEVASEDALAAHALDPAGFSILNRPTDAAAAAPTPPSAADGLGLLRSGTWVRDELGAPTLQVPAAAERKARRHEGDDPIIDALNVLRYVDRSVAALPVFRFDPEALTYKPWEDPFPRPDVKQGVERYDVFQIPVPTPTGKGDPALLVSIATFRKLSIYVRQGVVVQVREFVDLERSLSDLESKLGIRTPHEKSTAERAAIALAKINGAHGSQGDEPIRPRTLTVDLSLPHGVSTALPSEAKVASLLGLRNRGSATGQVPPLGTKPSAVTGATS
jgi:hypothetical protein